MPEKSLSAFVYKEAKDSCLLFPSDYPNSLEEWWSGKMP